MCKGKCSFFSKKYNERFYYCQGCAKRIGESNLIKEKNHGRLRCSCCNGLVRTKFMVYKEDHLVKFLNYKE